jgi:hypothetical protein
MATIVIKPGSEIRVNSGQSKKIKKIFEVLIFYIKKIIK